MLTTREPGGASGTRKRPHKCPGSTTRFHIRLHTSKKTSRILATTSASILLALPSFVITFTWDGGDAVLNIINDPQNSNPDGAPSSDLVNPDLIFHGTARLTPDSTVAFSADSLTFNNNRAVNAFIFTGQTLTIGAASGSAALRVQTGGTFNTSTGTPTVNPSGKLALEGGSMTVNGNLDVNGGQFSTLIGSTFNQLGGTFTTGTSPSPSIWGGPAGTSTITFSNDQNRFLEPFTQHAP